MELTLKHGYVFALAFSYWILMISDDASVL
jgi:hypothetical protein